MASTNAIVDGIDVTSQATIVLRAADRFREKNVISIHCKGGSIGELKR